MRFLYLLIVQFLSFPIWAQNQLENTDFNNLNVSDGLSQNIVETIYQGSNGFLWLGTQDGLNRYDGQDFISYQYRIDDSTSISNNYIKDIVEDQNGNLWIGTYGGGLNKFDKKSNFDHFLHDNKGKNSISDNVVYTIFQHSDSVYWLGTKNGLNKFNIITEEFSNPFTHPDNFPSLNNSVVYCISKAELEDVIWVGTREGLHRINIKTSQTEKFLKGEKGLKDDDIRDLYFDKNETLWVATKLGGLFYKTLNSNKFEQIDLKFVNENEVYARKIYPNESGGVWLGTFGAGLFYIESNFKTKHQFREEKYNQNTLPSSNIVEIYQDESSNYWLGTHGSGISSFNLNQKKFDLYQADENNSYSISDNAVNYIFEDSRGDIYIANDAGIDIVVEDSDELRFQQILSSYSGIPDDRAWLLFEDSEKIFWVGLWNFGLSRYNRDTGELKSYRNIEGDTTSITTNFIESIAEAPDGKLWVGLLGDGGLVVFDKDKEQFKRYKHDVNDPSSLSNNRVHKVFIDSRSRFWLATDYGLDLYQADTDNFKHYRYSKNDSNSINYNIIRTIIEDSNLSSTLICKFRFSYNSIDKASLRRYSGLYRGKITQYIGLYGKAFP
ncbi:two-component regulator propeller domain-containing protein, partial [Marivirga sp.]|uniref:ligand-binding sensor domain-containing protein n=1 Tax=Marivirga sp. TaxID=2018662 RepID=UPI0025FCB8BC